MTEVKILIEGYTTADTQDSGEERTCPTVTLVRNKNIVIVVDPGVLESQALLVEKLKENGLAIKDVGFVCITHSHIDHYRNVGMFPEAKVLEYWGLWNKNSVENWNEQFTDDIKIIKTPGHNYDCISLLVKTANGVVAIVGDVFWKDGEPKDDPYATDKKLLKQSREKILACSDWIIPGHGSMYKVRK
jgi:glyoxylase-like metal-dependent hydrolase (beta-lactamase superfamily II)